MEGLEQNYWFHFWDKKFGESYDEKIMAKSILKHGLNKKTKTKKHEG